LKIKKFLKSLEIWCRVRKIFLVKNMLKIKKNQISNFDSKLLIFFEEIGLIWCSKPMNLRGKFKNYVLKSKKNFWKVSKYGLESGNIFLGKFILKIKKISEKFRNMV